MASHIVLTSHPRGAGSRQAPAIDWGASSAVARGPLVAGLAEPAMRNVIGTHSGSYAVYRALAVAAGNLQADHRPDLTNTVPAAAIGPHGDQGGHRAGVVPARRGGAVQALPSGPCAALFEETGGMYPELVTRSDLEGLPAAHRRADPVRLRRHPRPGRPRTSRSPRVCTTSATAVMCSAATSAPAGPT
jgi:hypothetical protein